MKRFSFILAAVLCAVPLLANAQEATITNSTQLTIPLPILGPGCSPLLMLRTPLQVQADHVAALKAGALDRAMCDYAIDARVVMPGSVAQGLDQIRAGFTAMNQMFGGAIPEVTSVTTSGEVVLMTYQIYTPTLSIPDGSDTFVIRFGLIHYQVVHSPMVFGTP